jgi:hypothetical protein
VSDQQPLYQHNTIIGEKRWDTNNARSSDSMNGTSGAGEVIASASEQVMRDH